MEHNQNNLRAEYTVTPYTLALLPVQDGSKVYSRIIELEGEFICPLKPTDIIKKSCEYLGVSYEGRRSGTKKITGFTHKAPITIDPSGSLFFFPTASPLRPQCIWLAHDHILSSTCLDSKQTTVILRNKQSIVVNMSISSFKTQLHRTAFLKTKLLPRLEEIQRMLQDLANQFEWAQTAEVPSKYTLLRRI